MDAVVAKQNSREPAAHGATCSDNRRHAEIAGWAISQLRGLVSLSLHNLGNTLCRDAEHLRQAAKAFALCMPRPFLPIPRTLRHRAIGGRVQGQHSAPIGICSSERDREWNLGE